MKCDVFVDLVELYAIGSLETPDSEAFRYHLESGCESCQARLNEAVVQGALVSATVPLVEPPAGLRERIAASVAVSVKSAVDAPPRVVEIPKKQRRSFAPWLLAAAATIALVAGLAYEENARRTQTQSLSAALDAANLENEQAAQRYVVLLNILQAPGTKEVDLNVTEPDHPEGHLFVHAKLGVAMVIANLPNAPAGWKYESWVVPKSGDARPVESFARNKEGVAVTVVKGPVDVSQWDALAVSLEPENSTPVKPTKFVFADKV